MNKKGLTDSDILDCLQIIIGFILGFLIVLAILEVTQPDQCAVSYVKDGVINLRWINC